MLRDLVLMTCVIACLWLSIRHPFAGVLSWAWLAFMAPHREVYGVISTELRLNFTVAFVCACAWLFSKERKLPKADATIVVVGVFFVWMTFNSLLLAYSPVNAWNMWDRVWKTLALAFLVWASANNKVRIHALVWVVVVCLLYYGAKGGILSILSGGTKKITGPYDSAITDNNNFAVALLMTLPLINYLRMQSEKLYLRMGLSVGFVVSLLAVVSSYSRGAFLALGALAIVAWTRSRNKITYLIAAAAMAYPIYKFMPAAYFDRINTLNDVDGDASFQGRVTAWRVAYSYARDHFPFGSGLDGTQEAGIYFQYAPGETFHVAHSIYFQVLGDSGFVGLGLFLTLIILALLNCSRIRKATRNQPELLWARDLATMIQLSLIAYCVGGAALSLAYYDMFYIWILLLPPIWHLVSQRQIQKSKTPAMGFNALGPRAAEGRHYASVSDAR